jgi:osmoprotectant transport system ATP-binding protein
MAVRVGPDGAADGIVRHHDLVDHLAARRVRRAAGPSASEDQALEHRA